MIYMFNQRSNFFNFFFAFADITNHFFLYMSNNLKVFLSLCNYFSKRNGNRSSYMTFNRNLDLRMLNRDIVIRTNQDIYHVCSRILNIRKLYFLNVTLNI